MNEKKQKSSAKTIKSKPQKADHAVKNNPKTKSNIPYNVVRDTATFMGNTAAKKKMELQKQADGQTENPENYAVNRIEDKTEAVAYAAADTVYRSARYIKSRKSYTSKQDIPYIHVNTPVKNQPALNAPKTKDSVVPVQSNVQGQSEIKLRKQVAFKASEKIKNKKILTEKADIKTKETFLFEKSDKAEPPKVSKIAHIKEKSLASADIKTKEKYIKSHTSDRVHTYKVKSDKIYRLKSRAYIPKTLSEVKADKAEQKLSFAKKQAVQKYIKDKQVLKTKSDVTQDYEVKNIETIPQETISDIPQQTQKTVSPKQKPHEQIKVKHTDIKTKNSYVNSHSIKRVEKSQPVINQTDKRIVNQKKQLIKTKSQGEVKAIKNNTEKATVKNISVSKTAVHTKNKAEKITVKTQKQAQKQAAIKAAKRSKEIAQRSAQAVKSTAKNTVKFAKRTSQAVSAAAKAIVSAIASGGAVAVVVVILIIVVILASLAASPFGIFFSEEVNDVGTIPLSQIIAEYNEELTQETENVELSIPHTEVEIVDNQTDTNIIIAIFAAKTAGAEDNTAEDVVIFDDAKAERLKEYFRNANTVTHSILEITSDDETKTYLTITVDGKTKDELMDEYHLTAKQREAVETLLANGNILTASSHSLAITDADVQSIINGLPNSLPQKRKDVVKNAGSLVGKVNYFWGGKSSAIGWDSDWGSMQRVTAEGSPSSGSIRSYGLDCSGFVTWAFNNSGMGYAVGHGTYGQRDASVQVSATAVQAGDLCFLPSYSHVGIVVGKNESGSILVIHCSSSANNVVVSTAESVGFTVFRRPNCY